MSIQLSYESQENEEKDFKKKLKLIEQIIAIKEEGKFGEFSPKSKSLHPYGDAFDKLIDKSNSYLQSTLLVYRPKPK